MPVPRRTDWAGKVAFAICELGISVEEAWKLSPQEWWTLWSFKFGRRRKVMEGKGVSDEDADELVRGLEEQMKKEGRTRG